MAFWLFRASCLMLAWDSELDKNMVQKVGSHSLPMTRWYTSLPRSDRWRALLDTSRLNGFEHEMAALKRQSAPSSPQY